VSLFPLFFFKFLVFEAAIYANKDVYIVIFGDADVGIGGRANARSPRTKLLNTACASGQRIV